MCAQKFPARDLGPCLRVVKKQRRGSNGTALQVAVYVFADAYVEEERHGPDGYLLGSIALLVHANLQHSYMKTLITVPKREQAHLQVLKAVDRIRDTCLRCNT